MLLDILLTLFLVFLNGFFVASEFAIVKVRTAQVDLKVSQGSRSAKMAQHIVAHLDAYLAATQLGITLASLGLGWIGEAIVAEMIINLFHAVGYNVEPESAHKVAFPFAFGLITVLHIVFGELAPKSLAIRHPLETTIGISMLLRGFYLLFKPLIWLLNGLANFILKLIGIKPIHGHEIHTEEELKLILTQSEKGGGIQTSEHDLIQNVFEFDNRIVKQIYVPRTKISAIDIEDDPREIMDKVWEEGYSRLPVFKDSVDNIIGIIYAKDLLRAIKNPEINIKDFIRPAYYVPMNKRINELLREMQGKHIQMAIVTNEFGGTAGIVTMEDIIEELVGEIQDEYDEEKPVVEKKNEKEFIVNALSAISDVNEYLPRPLPESLHYDTVSGFMNYLFGRIPSVDEKVTWEGYEFTITKRQRHSVETVKIRLIEKPVENKKGTPGS